ncbi:hypothetical protein CCHR01_17460 [Colletotrichum chrysophilum]|uniref:Uncharacterized protein n=1 Tax=Colletotrichum chrysophilum TaxID=1836956 RepID=A0AAD9A4D0_9PEZI|nr:hypothetical protein CCHR01_17460 [Colletotrichum chrysophilum]
MLQQEEETRRRTQGIPLVTYLAATGAVSLRFTHRRCAHAQACCIIVQILVIYDPNGSEAVANKPSSVSESLILTKSSVGMDQLGGRQSAVAFTVSSDYKKPHPYSRRYCGEVLNKGSRKKKSSDASSPAYAAILGCVYSVSESGLLRRRDERSNSEKSQSGREGGAGKNTSRQGGLRW